MNEEYWENLYLMSLDEEISSEQKKELEEYQKQNPNWILPKQIARFQAPPSLPTLTPTWPEVQQKIWQQRYQQLVRGWAAAAVLLITLGLWTYLLQDRVSDLEQENQLLQQKLQSLESKNTAEEILAIALWEEQRGNWEKAKNLLVKLKQENLETDIRNVIAYQLAFIAYHHLENDQECLQELEKLRSSNYLQPALLLAKDVYSRSSDMSIITKASEFIRHCQSQLTASEVMLSY